MATMRESYPARPEALARARHAAVRRAKNLGADDSVAQAVALAVTEACSNVVVHAYRDAARPGAMTVALERPNTHLCLYVTDDGIGIRPRLDSPGLGLGIPLISELTAAFELRKRPEGGTELCMRFALRMAER